MDKKDFFARWELSFQKSCAVLESFPVPALTQTVIGGLRPPGELFCHMYAHVNAVFNACVTGHLDLLALQTLPHDIDTTHHQPLLRFAHSTMYLLFAHAAVSAEVWKKDVDTPWGHVPMDSLCLESFAHEVHHRGQLYAMLRSLGIAPPPFCRHESP